MFSFFRKSKKDLREKRDNKELQEEPKRPVKNTQCQILENTPQGVRNSFGDDSDSVGSGDNYDSTTKISNETQSNELKMSKRMVQNGDVCPKSVTPRQSPISVKPCGHGTVAISPKIPVPVKKRQQNDTPPDSPKIEIGNKRKLSGNLLVPVQCNGFDTQPVDAPDNVGFKKIQEEGIKKNLINQEAKFQKQLNELNQQVAQRDADASKLRFQLEELQRDVFTKSAGLDRLQSELQAAHKESDTLRAKLKQIEDESLSLKQKTCELQDENNTKTQHFLEYENDTKAKIVQLEGVIKDLQENIKKLQNQVEELCSEKDKLEKEHEVILNEKEEQKKLIEQALEEALSKKSDVEKKWEQEFEKLRTVNIIKEQQTFEDFEWKLREVEQLCKKKLQDKDKDIEDRLQEACKDAEIKLKMAHEIMEEVQHLKSYETQIEELRGVTQEQEKCIKLMTEQQAQMQHAGLMLKEESTRLRKLIDTEKENLQHIQRLHHQELVDKERKLHNTLEEKKTEIAMYWEERLLHECGRLKFELEQLHNEEKAFAMETIRKQKDDELSEHKIKWEEKLQESLKEISSLKKTIKDSENRYRSEMEQQQSKTDRDIMELRRVMDKIDMVHHNNFEKMVQVHEDELERLKEENGSKLKEAETAYLAEICTLRASLEWVKEKMAQDSQQKIEVLIAQHRAELDTQWANLIHQKSEAIKLVEDEYVDKYNRLEEQFYAQQKSHESREIELLKSIDALKNEISSKNSAVDDLQNNVDTLEGGVQVLNCTIRNLQKEIAELQQQHESDKNQYESNVMQIKKQSNTTIDHLQRKCECLTKLFEEVRSRYERRESRQEDLNQISDLKQVIAEQEKDLACINEEKRYYQMKLMSLQKSLEEDEDDFEDTRDFDEDSKQQQLQQQQHSLAIPPTIPECEEA
ncbi:protein FAM184A isoform X1 [Onthophagus taurus]|uniref:protein FAM184A isoform X1 n=1 Tax=Onthophagus taurus TaxID=166361 RepID=UPI0039BE7E60